MDTSTGLSAAEANLKDNQYGQHVCLIIHGFAGSICDVLPIQKFLSSKGWHVKCSRLPGHTGENRDLVRASHRDWLESTKRDLQDLVGVTRDSATTSARGVSETDGTPRFAAVVGFSMGSLLAVNLATKQKVDALVLLNTPIYCGNTKMVALNVFRDLRVRNPVNLTRYARRLADPPPFRALCSFRALLRKTKPLFPTVTCPVFIGQSMKDDTVRPKSADFVFRNVSSKHKVIRYYPNSGHVICHEPDAQAMLSDVWQFLTDVCAPTT